MWYEPPSCAAVPVTVRVSAPYGSSRRLEVSEIVDGAYTGNLAGPFCYADGKVEAVDGSNVTLSHGPISMTRSRLTTYRSAIRWRRG